MLSDGPIPRLQDHSSDFSNGLSLLLIRPTTLLSSIHHLIILLGLQLTTITTNPSSIPPPTFSSQPQTRDLSVTELALPYIQRELSIIREVMDKTKGLEGKVAYQVKKLVALAESAGVAAANGSTKEIEDDQEANGELLSSLKSRVTALIYPAIRPIIIPTEPGSSPCCFQTGAQTFHLPSRSKRIRILL